ncbi:MAG: Kdo hydroxylase family protein [Thermoanaerobaculia bacterium]
MSKVGLLWDSLSANTGDQAVGLAALRLARRAGLSQVEPVHLGASVSTDYDCLIVGGGELLHPEGHPFYDLFRVPGEHILNTAGCFGEVEAGHLSSYRLVSVRSLADREQLSGVHRDSIEVAPCLTVLFPDLVEDGATPQPAGTTLVHLHAGALTPIQAPTVVAWLEQLEGPVALLPFTHYNRDEELLGHFARAAGLAAPLETAHPDQAFAAIQRAKAVVVASLHAAIFAYSAGVPFLVFGYSPKVEHFLAERGLGQRLLRNASDLASHTHLLAPGTVDWEPQLRQDRATATALFERIASAVEGVRSHVRPNGQRAMMQSSWRPPPRPDLAHEAMIEVHAKYASVRADRSFQLLRARSKAAGVATEEPTRNAAATADSLARQLERGELVFFEKCPFPLPTGSDLEFLLARQLDGHAKSITLFPATGVMGGQQAGTAEDTVRLKAVLEDFSREASRWLARALPRYHRAARLGPLRFRLVEEKGRPIDPRISGALLHVDANSDQAAHGGSFLRVFVNINPTVEREWLTSESLGSLLDQWGEKVREPGETRPDWRTRLRLRFGGRFGIPLPETSTYDQLMMRLHFFGKTDPYLQEQAPTTYWAFPPGSAWVVFSDLVSHAVVGGQFAIDQTYLVPPHAFVEPERSTRAVIERFWAGKRAALPPQ